ncbi:hypothetical protein Lal_00012216 [Lupinus albus]|nr:hypothetical protein Lal_00012216 [Lupinus albus]
MISARATRWTTIVSPVTTRVELSQKVWYSCLFKSESERASRISYSRLSERFSPERERLTWDGEILEYTGRFSPERELSRLGEKYHFGSVGTVRFSLEREGQI